jgi:hypothetical protein
MEMMLKTSIIRAITHLSVGVGLAAAATAEVSANPIPAALDNEIYKISLDQRIRVELADVDGADDAQAYTLRTRLGVGLKPWKGISVYGELENTWSFDNDSYFDAVSAPNGKTTIADPENTELNRAFVQFEKAEWMELTLKAGRQRIILDDARFVGNVGWRQNEQTFDAAAAQTSFGIEGLTAQYAYLWDIQRIFGDKGSPATRDFSSDSHLVRAHYAGLEDLAFTAFVYLLDFGGDSPGNSANSYGIRANGHFDLTDELYLNYAGSYAYQHDAANNPIDYSTHYLAAEATLGKKSLGDASIGYELLGSDSGARFVTPLATAHKFNGFADAFLDNGGPNGLQDLYVTLAPNLPWKLKGKLSYHHFWSDHGSDTLGNEVDAVLSRSLNQYLTALTKVAWFDGDRPGPPDLWRVWFQLSFKY